VRLIRIAEHSATSTAALFARNIEAAFCARSIRAKRFCVRPVVLRKCRCRVRSERLGDPPSRMELTIGLISTSVARSRATKASPKADPSGDYAFALFAKADKLRAGARVALESRALQLTGGPTSEKSPPDQNPYAWILGGDQ
jgi:hypothetical protein